MIEIISEKKPNDYLYFKLACTCAFLFLQTLFLHSVRCLAHELEADKRLGINIEAIYSSIWLSSLLFGFPWGVLSDLLSVVNSLFLCTMFSILSHSGFFLYLFARTRLATATSVPFLLCLASGFVYGLALMMTRVTINRANSLLHNPEYLATVISFNSAFGHVASATTNLVSTEYVARHGFLGFFQLLTLLTLIQLFLVFFMRRMINEQTETGLKGKEIYQKMKVHVKDITNLPVLYFLTLFVGVLIEATNQGFKNQLSIACRVIFEFSLEKTGKVLFMTKFLVILKPVVGFLIEKFFPGFKPFVFPLSSSILILVHFGVYLTLKYLHNLQRPETVFLTFLILRAFYELLFFPFMYGFIGRTVDSSLKGVAFGLVTASLGLGNTLIPILGNMVAKNSFAINIRGEVVQDEGILNMQIVFIGLGFVALFVSILILWVEKRNQAKFQKKIINGFN